MKNRKIITRHKPFFLGYPKHEFFFLLNFFSFVGLIYNTTIINPIDDVIIAFFFIYALGLLFAVIVSRQEIVFRYLGKNPFDKKIYLDMDNWFDRNYFKSLHPLNYALFYFNTFHYIIGYNLGYDNQNIFSLSLVCFSIVLSIIFTIISLYIINYKREKTGYF